MSSSVLAKAIAALAASASLASAVPASSNTAPSSNTLTQSFYETGAYNTTVYRFSKILPTVFGQPAADYDFVLAEAHDGIHNATQSFATHVASREQKDDHDSVHAFINALGTNLLSQDQAKNTTFLCNKLPETMHSSLRTCDGLIQTQPQQPLLGLDAPSRHQKRLQYLWTLSSTSKWAASLLSVSGLQVYLATVPDSSPITISPRSWCRVGVDGIRACISWSVDQPQLYPSDLANAVEDAMQFAAE